MKKRIFKFRAWDPEAQVFTYYDGIPGSIHHDLGSRLLLNNSNKDRDILMQWTGFVDSEGRDIYEGDVVIQHGEEGLLEVYWKEAYGCWYAYEDGEYGGGFEETLSDLFPVEVIGNIWENPELTGGDDED